MRMPQSMRGWSARGFQCTQDCSGHEKGWNWGAAFEIKDRNYANGNSASFNAGVRAYAETQRRVRRVRQVQGYFQR